jgi:hypothetical protein
MLMLSLPCLFDVVDRSSAGIGAAGLTLHVAAAVTREGWSEDSARRPSALFAHDPRWDLGRLQPRARLPGEEARL